MASEHEHEWKWTLAENGATERRCACGDEDWYAPASELMHSLQQISDGKKAAGQQLAQARALLERVRNVQIGALAPALKDDIIAFLAAHPGA